MKSIDVTSPREIEVEIAVPPDQVPVLSTWSMAAFIGLLLLAGSWFLRQGYSTVKR